MFSHLPTFGVEEEFLIVDPVTGEPVPLGPAVVRLCRGTGSNLQEELTLFQVETATHVHTELESLLDELKKLRGTTAAQAEACGGRLVAAGMPLTEVECGAEAVDNPRYRRIADEFGLISRETAVCGCHVHVAVPDRDAAIQVGNYIRPWLPVLLALTANSAIYRATITGYASWRNITWRRWPVSGPPPHFGTTAEYDARVDLLLASGTILDSRMVYWDVRPSLAHPTVEIRVSDVPLSVAETAVLAGLARALVASALTSIAEGLVPPILPDSALTAAYWRAARFGMGGDGFDPWNSRTLPARAQLDRLLEYLEPVLTASGDQQFMDETLGAILARGNGATRQLKAFQDGNSVPDVVAVLADATLEGCRSGPDITHRLTATNNR
ncbi:glutamate--cysteine ligase [Nocardia brasiliensis]|uniref:carboxylate-amine ligase n=1 Tax=Nocardia brasiliensis TaxID=37326 RepID=UPI0037B536EE